MLADFSSRIKELFPNAKELTTLNPAGPEILESAGQCILKKLNKNFFRMILYIFQINFSLN